MTASAVISGVGGAAALAGTITSVVAVSKEKHGASATISMADGGTKGLNLASNITAGISTATSGASLVLGGLVLSKLNKDAENARNCEDALQQ
jgi:hypothetical protein